MTPVLSDVRLSRRASEGDQRAFAAIYKRYHQELYRFCHSILGNPEDAQDALQNTMVKALRALPGEQRQIALKPWLYRVARNESVDLLRKRRDAVELDPATGASVGGLAETAATRERLRRLFGDLATLPERQRSALTMRELGGLGFDQIGEALEASAAVARQTVYEARLNLRQLEAGREMGCELVMHQLSEGDGRVTRRRDIQAHLRECRDCREFGQSIAARRRDFAALSPLPAAAAGSILHGVLTGKAAGAGIAGTVATGVGGAAATGTAVKAVATVAVVAAIGVTAADRGGLIDAHLPGGAGSAVHRPATSPRAQPGMAPPAASTPANGAVHSAAEASLGATKRPDTNAGKARSPGQSSQSPTATKDGEQATNGSGHGPAAGPPTAAQHGQETAAAHKGANGSNPSKADGHVPPGQAKKQGQPESHPAHPTKEAGQPHGNGNPHGKSKSQSPPGEGATPGAPSPATGHKTPKKEKSSPAPEPESSGAPADGSPGNSGETAEDSP